LNNLVAPTVSSTDVVGGVKLIILGPTTNID